MPMDRASLTGVWDGQFTYADGRGPPTGFTAVLFETGGALGGTTHERSRLTGRTIHAMLSGSRSANEVSFIKTYDASLRPFYGSVSYAGRLNDDATQIEGTWTIPRMRSGRFRMTRSQGRGASESIETRQAEPVG